MFTTLVLATGIAGAGMDYPETRKVDHVDQYHGISVSDPYRWLEQPISDPEVKAWVDEENKLTFGYLDSIKNRDRLLNELLRRVNYERFTIPTKRGSRYYFSRNDGLQNQDVVYMSEALDDPGQILLDPNTLSKDGTVALAGMDVAEDSSKLLFATSSSGSDWCEWQVMDISSKQLLPDRVKWSKFGVGFWDKSGDGFYYLRFPEPDAATEFTQATNSPKVMYHKLGDSQDKDTLIFEDKENPERSYWPQLDDEKEVMYLVVNEPSSVNNRLWAIDLTTSAHTITRLADANDADYYPVHRMGSTYIVQTTKDAPLGKLTKFETVKRMGPIDIVPESKDTLESASFVGGKLMCLYMQDAQSTVRTFDSDGNPGQSVALPGSGTAAGFGGKPGDKETFYSFVSMDQPSMIFRYDVESGKSTLFKQPKLPFDASKYESKQVFVTSKDGTKFPMFLAFKKGTKLDGTNPTILYGYGGFNNPLKPWFSTSRTVWMDMGGVFAAACIRGGGEYGKPWHEGATKVRRQNAYDDFIAAGEWLVKEKYCNNSHLALQGGSNGGLLVGAVMNQRPDLAGVCLPAVGVMDMLRFNQFTVGKYWESDYGSPENVDEFFALLRISPYHNLTPGTNYPATLVTTADTDDRVVPAHSFKYAARLQECQSGKAPVLIRVETSAGHGGGKPITKALEELRDEYAFTLANMGKKIPAKF